MRPQFNGVIGHHRVQRQHVRGGQAQPAAAGTQRGQLRRGQIDDKIAIGVAAAQQGEVAVDDVGAQPQPVCAQLALQAVGGLDRLFQAVEQITGVADDAGGQARRIADHHLRPRAGQRFAIIPAEARILHRAVIAPVIAGIARRGSNQRRMAILVGAGRGQAVVAAAQPAAGPFDGDAADIGAQAQGPVIGQPMIEPQRSEVELVVAGHRVGDAEQRRIDDLGVAITGEFVVDVEEGLVLRDRSAEREAGLITFETFAYRIPRQVATRKGRGGVQRPAGADQRIGFAVQLVGARWRGIVDDAVGGAPIGNRIAVGEHGHAAGEAQRHRELDAAKEILVIVEAVDQIIGVEAIAAVDRDRRRFREEAGAGHHVRQPDQRTDHVAAFDGQRGQLLTAQRGGDFGVDGVEAHHSPRAGHRDGLANGGQPQGDAAGKIAAQGERLRFGGVIGGAGSGADAELAAGGQAFQPQQALRIGAGHAAETGAGIFDDHFHIGCRCAA